ncbi:hypothetical protein Hanom_Chr01g00073131 [Helianthus anomalus]
MLSKRHKMHSVFFYFEIMYPLCLVSWVSFSFMCFYFFYEDRFLIILILLLYRKLQNIIGSLLNGTLLTMLNPLAWVMEVAAIMAIALANGRVTDLKFSTVFKYATTLIAISSLYMVNHLIGSFRTSGIGVALSGPDGGCPPNCCITCSGFFFLTSSTRLKTRGDTFDPFSYTWLKGIP